MQSNFFETTGGGSRAIRFADCLGVLGFAQNSTQLVPGVCEANSNAISYADCARWRAEGPPDPPQKGADT